MRRFLTTLALLCLVLTSFAANRTIQGVVISAEDDFRLIGASIYVSPEDLKKAGINKPSLGVVTDIDGNFTFDVPASINRIYCSYIGFDVLEVKLTDKADYKIYLNPNSTQLDAVVVTGYQSIERRKLTAAISKVDVSDGLVGSVRSIDQALSGQIAGMAVTPSTGAPGAPVKIRIRGTSSLNGTQDPLWVLDGIPLEGTDVPELDRLNDIDDVQQSSIAGINPSDIESITVLKDAAATAIYGARAANGVIVITTKSGKQGKPVVTFSTKMTYQPKQGMDNLNLLNSSQKVGLELDLIQSGYAYAQDKGEVARILSRYNMTDSYINGGWNALSPEAQGEINRLSATQTDWNDILFQDVFNQEYNLSISGGGEKATYYTSVGYFDEKGNVPGVDASRFNIVGKTSYKVNSKLKVGASLFANRRENNSYLTDINGLTNPMYYSRLANPYFSSYNEDGGYNYDTDIQNSDKGLNYNIFEERKNTSNKTLINSFSSIFDAELRLNDQFKFITQLGLQLDKSSRSAIADQESFAMRMEKDKSRYYEDGGYKYFLPDGGMHKAYESTSSQVTWKGMAEYRTSFNDIHELEVMAGAELRRTWYETLFSAGYGFDRKTLTTKPIIFPDESDAESFPLHQSTYKENAYVSGFSTVSYTLMNRYTLGGSIRFDGSDLFGVDKKYRYLPLYSLSALWRLSNEPFMQNADWIDNMVMRASYGLQGNIDKNTSPFLLGKYEVNTILPDGSEHMISINSAPNAKLRWEKTQSINAGFDVSLLDQAVSVSVDYYSRLGTDLIGMQQLPLESGFASSTINWASMRNKGVEVSITTRNIQTKNFSWFTNFNFGYNKNEVLEEAIRDDQRTPGRKGYSAGAVFALKTAGIDSEGYPLYLNKAGEKVSVKELYKLEDPGWGFPSAISHLTAEEERDLYTYMGTTDAPYTGGLTNTFTYKRVELGINCIFNLGGVVRTSPSYSLTTYDRGKNTNTDILNAWSPNNPNGTLPGLLSPDKRMDEFYWFDFYNQSHRDMDVFVKKLNYMRIQNIRLGYRFSDKITKALGIGAASVALEGRNLFVFSSNYDNFSDPETMDNPFALPIPKSFTMSLNVNF
jgi:TonB-linked SusC/RagA family outer membrane protein